MDSSHFVRFEEISHVLIEEGFGDLFIKSKIISSLSLLGRMQLLFERKIPLANRIQKSCERLGPTFVNFAKYLGTRTDVLPHHMTDVLAKTKLSKNYTIPKPQGKFTKVDLSAHRFDGFSYVVTAKKASTPVVIHYIPKGLAKNYKIDLDILFFFAEQLDKYVSLDISARKLVHGYTSHVHERHNLELNVKLANLYKGSVTDKTIIPQYVSKSPSCLVAKKVKGVPCSDMPKALLTYHNVHDIMLDNLNKALLAPVFSHGFLLTDVDFDNIVVKAKGQVSLNHISFIEKLSKRQVGEISLFISSFLTKNTQAIVDQFCPQHHHTHAIKSISVHLKPTVKSARNVLDELHKLNCRIPKHIFDFLAVAQIAEEIGFAFTGNRNLLVRLKSPVEKHMKEMIKDDLDQAKKLSKAKSALKEKAALDTQIYNLERMVFPHHQITFEFLSLIVILACVILLLIILANISVPIWPVVTVSVGVAIIISIMHKHHKL